MTVIESLKYCTVLVNSFNLIQNLFHNVFDAEKFYECVFCEWCGEDTAGLRDSHEKEKTVKAH